MPHVQDHSCLLGGVVYPLALHLHFPTKMTHHVSAFHERVLAVMESELHTFMQTEIAHGRLRTGILDSFLEVETCIIRVQNSSDCATAILYHCAPSHNQHICCKLRVPGTSAINGRISSSYGLHVLPQQLRLGDWSIGMTRVQSTGNW
jgi:hypothetical protein